VYTYEIWFESQADKYYRIIIDTCKEIASSPKIGKKYALIEKGLLGFRVGKHIIFYREIKLKEIEIIRILHEKMDLKNRMDE
jgi:toxin ParE1/3/4